MLIEDDQETAAYVARGLREHGHVVDEAATGRDGLFLATDGGHDVLVVDRMATAKQQAALIDLARSLAGGLIQEVAEVKAASMEVAIGGEPSTRLSTVKSTR